MGAQHPLRHDNVLTPSVICNTTPNIPPPKISTGVKTQRGDRFSAVLDHVRRRPPGELRTCSDNRATLWNASVAFAPAEVQSTLGNTWDKFTENLHPCPYGSAQPVGTRRTPAKWWRGGEGEDNVTLAAVHIHATNVRKTTPPLDLRPSQ